MSVKTDRFINAIAPIVINEYLSREKWVLPSVCIAQASLESGWNINARTLFGIKGKGFTATTTEYYNGNKVVIEDSFRLYPDVASSVVGYFDLITNSKLYQKVVNEPDYKKAVNGLINTGFGYGYATDPNYVKKVISIIENYNLTRFDTRTVANTSKPSEVKKSIEEVAKEVIKGLYGNGSERKSKLESEGYDYKEVQSKVNDLLKASEPKKKKATKKIANDVIKGLYGNGSERKAKLEAEGYDYKEVQNLVNSLLK
jgi:hypothetical protein